MPFGVPDVPQVSRRNLLISLQSIVLVHPEGRNKFVSPDKSTSKGSNDEHILKINTGAYKHHSQYIFWPP